MIPFSLGAINHSLDAIKRQRQSWLQSFKTFGVSFSGPSGNHSLTGPSQDVFTPRDPKAF